MITEIGSLVKIVSGLLDIGKAGSGMFSRGDKSQKQIIALQERIGGIAEQLHKCVQLDRLIPVWEQRFKEFNQYLNAQTLSDKDARHIESELQDLIRGASKDYFSGAFFLTEYDVVPEVHKEIIQFRVVVTRIDEEIAHIPPGVWSQHWPQLAGRLRDLRQATKRVQDALEQTLATLFKELREASLAKP